MRVLPHPQLSRCPDVTSKTETAHATNTKTTKDCIGTTEPFNANVNETHEKEHPSLLIMFTWLIFIIYLFFAIMTISHSNISEMTIKSVIPSEQHKGVAPHQSPLTVLQDIL